MESVAACKQKEQEASQLEMRYQELRLQFERQAQDSKSNEQQMANHILVQEKKLLAESQHREELVCYSHYLISQVLAHSCIGGAVCDILCQA